MQRTVGLDFGTTNSVVGIVRSQRADKVDFLYADNEEPHPSVVWYRGGSVVVGRDAKRHLTDPAGTSIGDDAIRSPKRLLGREHDTVIAGQPRSAEMVVCEVLRFLHSHAARHGEPFSRAVMTIPVKLDGRGRRQLRAAASRAGFSIDQFVHEPHAALYGYLREHPNLTGEMARFSGQYMMVFDWGGGTLDVTLCRLVDGILTQVTSIGDNTVGGDWFDRNLMDYVRGRHAKRFGLSMDQLDRVPGGDARLWEQCELAKKELSTKASHTLFLTNYLRGGAEATIKEDLSRADLERCAIGLLDAGFGLVDRVLTVAGINERSVALCLATGGMVRMPAIRQRLLERFDPSRLHEPERGDLAISGGAAWIAHDRAELRLAKPIEVLLASGNYVPLIRAKTALPRDGQQLKLPDLDLYCADPRDGHAKIELARPITPDDPSTSSPRSAYDCVIVQVDPNALPLRERIELRGAIDHDLVVELSARSTLRGDRATKEIIDLEFGLALGNGIEPSGTIDSSKFEAPFSSVEKNGAVVLRSNVTHSKDGWTDVPGELISDCRCFIPWPNYQYTERQRDEEAYYKLCSICRRTMYELNMYGCDYCAARGSGPSPEEAAKVRASYAVRASPT